MFRPYSSPLRLALFVGLVLLTLGAHATDYVRARVYTRAGESFQLYVDGSPVGQSTSTYDLPALASGYHWLEFRFPNRRLPQGVTGYRTQAWFAPGFESIYELDAFPVGQRMKLTRIACTPLDGTAYTPPATTPVPGNSYNPGYDPATTGAPACAAMMAPNDLNALLETIRSRDFESTKLSVAKQGLDQQVIMAEDVKRIMKLFDYENTRLDFAKFAYSRCCDQRNYFKINDAFEYDSSVGEMQRFTSGRR